MFHLVHPSLARAAALDPYRLRHRILVAATLAAAALLATNGVGSTLAAASESEVIVPTSQNFTAAAITTAPVEVAEYTVELRPILVYPVGIGAPIGSFFGLRDQACDACSTQHQGVDWNPGRGTPIVAIADGVVSQVGPAGSGLGVWVAIDHVINGQAITSIYAHMESGSMPYALGAEVRVGDPVGTVGSTGVTTAPHLHFELHIGGTAVNPLAWMQANGAQ